MANSNFLLFDVNGTNMLSDADYGSDDERTDGVAQGISRSILFNKVLRQTTAMAAALGSVMANRGFDALDNNQAALVNSINSAFPESRGLPAGSIVEYSGNLASPPEGLLFCDGNVFDPTRYPELAAVYQTGPNTYLYGEVQQTGGAWWPKTPDLRGAFLRGLDLGKGKDPDRTLGVAQNDAIRNITGSFEPIIYYDTPLGVRNPSGCFSSSNQGWISLPDGAGDHGPSRPRQVDFDASRIVPTANENRPYNFAVIHLVVAISGFNLPNFQSGDYLKNLATGSGSLTILGAPAGSTGAINIGNGSASTANGAIQLGPGTNSSSNSLSVGLGSGNYELLQQGGTIPAARVSNILEIVSELPEEPVPGKLYFITGS